MGKVLVAYFSATGRTKKAALGLAAAVGGDIYEIMPAEPYTKADLNWMNPNSRSSVEMKKDPSIRPAIAGSGVQDMSQYDTVFVAAPIWWYRLPTIINSFLESYDMSGKRIVLFATSGTSGLGNSAEALRESAPGAEIVDGCMLNRVKKEEEFKEIGERFV